MTIPGLTVSSYLSWPGSVMFSPDYPANTVKGRICLLYRLDWDKDRLKETSDIYIKPRLIVMASIGTIGCLLFYTIHKVNVSVRKFCPSNKTHASIGGRSKVEGIISQTTSLRLSCVRSSHRWGGTPQLRSIRW